MKDINITKEMLKPLSDDKKDLEQVVFKSMPYWHEVWHRLIKNKLALLGIITILLLFLTAIFVPFLVDYDYSDDNLDRVNIPPVMEILEDSEGNKYFINKDYRVYAIENG